MNVARTSILFNWSFLLRLKDGVRFTLSLSLSAGFLMSRDPMFYFSLAALFLGIVGGLYLFFEWLRHGKRHRFLLFWSSGIIMLYVFQIPIILFNAGQQFVLTNFNPFFQFSFPLTFLGFLLIYAGILSVINPATYKKTCAYLASWLAIVIIFFAFYFRDDMVFTSRLPLYGSILLFFLPLHLLILYALWRWYRMPTSCVKTAVAKVGLMLIAVSELAGVFRSAWILRGVTFYPPAFWLVVLSSQPILLAQTIGMLLLLTGFLFVHRDCFRNSTECLE